MQCAVDGRRDESKTNHRLGGRPRTRTRIRGLHL